MCNGSGFHQVYSIARWSNFADCNDPTCMQCFWSTNRCTWITILVVENKYILLITYLIWWCYFVTYQTRLQNKVTSHAVVWRTVKSIHKNCELTNSLWVDNWLRGVQFYLEYLVRYVCKEVLVISNMWNTIVRCDGRCVVLVTTTFETSSRY